MKPNDADSYLRLISDMITDKNFDHAAAFLKSLREQIKKTGRLSEKQKQAVFNIYNGGGR